MTEAVLKSIENVCVGDHVVERDGALLRVRKVEHQGRRVIVTCSAFGPSPDLQIRRNVGSELYVLPTETPLAAVADPAPIDDAALARARADLLAAGFSEDEIEAPTGFGLRRLATCPAVAPLVVKVAAGALSIQGALNTRKAVHHG